MMIEKEQALLAQIIDLFAQRFDRNAVLCGGMERATVNPGYIRHLVFLQNEYPPR